VETCQGLGWQRRESRGTACTKDLVRQPGGLTVALELCLQDESDGYLSVVGRLTDAAAQANSLEEVGHRPWPLNPQPWFMGQTWQRLLFAHWPVAHDLLRPHVPRELTLEEWDGSAWIGLTPFRVTGLRLRGIPPLPLLSSFYELNCRTYVRHDDRPGIWFFSLDASSAAAVAAARLGYRLPYRHASIEATEGRFSAKRNPGDVSFEARYRGAGDVHVAQAGTLEYFLVERYCLYSGGGRLRADIHHAPWPLQRAEAEVMVEGVSPVELEGDPICHYAHRQDVLVWRPESIS
jgi:hypothetical protein